VSRKYYFDNTLGNRNFYSVLQEAETLSNEVGPILGPTSLFYKYLDVLDPDATVVTTLDNDAIVLVEINNHVTAPILDHLINNISITDNVIFVSMTETICAAEEYSQRYGLKFITMPIMHDTANIKNLALVQPFLVSPDLYPNVPAFTTTGPKDYLFLNLNRRVTNSRKAMHAALDLKKLIAKKPYVVKDPTRGLVSMHWVTISTNEDLSEDIISDKQINDHTTVLTNLARVKTIPMPRADEYAHWKFKNSHHYPKWYSDTWFSLVTESTAHAHYVSKPCLSEKTVMAMLIGHPFLLYADNGAIQLLRDLGFDTFDWLFDHSYDTELDPSVKLKNILKQIKNFNIANAIEQVDRINETIKFNRAHCRSDVVKQAVSVEWKTAIEELVS
jgi:hypothetical protein